MEGALRCAKHVAIIVTLSEVSEIAETVEGLPTNFDPVAWLQENRKDIAIVATEAVKDVIWEALQIGLADHPLVLQSASRKLGATTAVKDWPWRIERV